MLLPILTFVSAGAFLFYGYETLFGVPPRNEYERYGVSQFRVFVGCMQLLGAVGAVVGLVIAPIGLAATGGLTLMMLLGLLVRLRIHDAPRSMIPAALLAALNAAVFSLYLL